MATDMLRITTSQLIKKYHFELAPHDNGKRVLGEMLDQLAPNPGPLSLVMFPIEGTIECDYGSQWGCLHSLTVVVICNVNVIGSLMYASCQILNPC